MLKGVRCFHYGFTKKGTFKISDTRKIFDTFKVIERFTIFEVSEQKAINKIARYGGSIGSRSTTNY